MSVADKGGKVTYAMKKFERDARKIPNNACVLTSFTRVIQ